MHVRGRSSVYAPGEDSRNVKVGCGVWNVECGMWNVSPRHIPGQVIVSLEEYYCTVCIYVCMYVCMYIYIILYLYYIILYIPLVLY